MMAVRFPLAFYNLLIHFSVIIFIKTNVQANSHFFTRFCKHTHEYTHFGRRVLEYLMIPRIYNPSKRLGAPFNDVRRY